MIGDGDPERDLAALVVRQAGRLVATGNRYEPYQLLDPDGARVVAVTAYFRDLLAAGRSESTVRSYGMDLLRWFRFLWSGTGIAWDRATRVEARDFCRWMQIAGKQPRPHWRASGAASPSKPARGQAFAPSVRAHSETVLRWFYDFHQTAGSGPIINPFPLDRSRRAGRAHAHHNPMEPHGNERSGRYRPRVPGRIPRSIPDSEFNEIFARLPSHRDRALVAFYVSTGARASELLSTTLAGVDPGRQLITVVRKGTGELQELPASPDAFVWLRLYQVQMADLIPKGRRQPLWWTLRRPARPLTYHAVHRMFERVNQQAGTAVTLHALRHTAAYRMAEDPALPLTDVQFVLGHAQLTTTQIYLTPRKEDVIRRVLTHHAEQTRRAVERNRPAPGAWLPAGHAGRLIRKWRLVTATVEDAHLVLPRTPPTGRQAARIRFPARRFPETWSATCQGRDEVLDRLTRAPFVVNNSHTEKIRRRGLTFLLDWLEDQPGRSWQERWLASGADAAGAGWRKIPARWLQQHGLVADWRLEALASALLVAISADLVRPALGWLVAKPTGPGGLVRHLGHARDPDGFARLRALCDADPHVSSVANSHTRHRAAEILAAKGGLLADVTVGDVLELLDAELDTLASVPGDAAVFYRLLRAAGLFGPDAPATLREIRGSAGPRTPEELIDRYRLACRPIRDLLVDYLRERQPSLDYSSMESLACALGARFWRDLEIHHPGIDSLRLPDEVAAAWKQRLRTKQKTITAETGEKIRVDVPRINYRECLIPIRAFYLDLAQWAVDDPGRWAQWAVPCPIKEEEVNRRKLLRHRKSRRDARTRERLPVLPTLVRTVNEHRKATEVLLQAARHTQPGKPFTAAGQPLIRSATRHGAVGGKVWADDPGTGKRRDLEREEDHAFWAWAIVEVLRATGIRVEELLELSHHSFVQYRLPTTDEIVPLLQIVPSKTDEERLLLVSPELADVLSTVIHRVRDHTGKIPLIPSYDWQECVWLPPSPLLFQRRFGAERRRISPDVVRDILAAALVRTGLTDPSTGEPLRFTPHDFRRLFITDAIMSGLPPHIAQVIAGHRDINVTMGYKAVYPDEAIQSHLAFLARRRAMRPTEEYRVPTDAEWQEFLGHFERRKVSTGICGRAVGTPCVHEHSCLRCSMHWPDPAQRQRIAEIRDNLIARIAEAEREGWLGEVEGLKISLAGANDKLTQIDRRSTDTAVDLGLPNTQHPKTSRTQGHP